MTGSRSTYRKPAHEVAWQRQLRDRYNDEGVPEGADLSLKRARVVPVGRAIAQSIILRYEWLGTLGSSGLFYGLMFGAHCGGVCCVALSGSGTAGPTVGRKFGIQQKDVATLARGACAHWAPPGANSKLVSWTTKLLGRGGRARIVLAYSDSDAGEVGTIYQACGWTYVGTTKRPAGAEYVSPAGRVLNSQSIGAWARKHNMRFRDYERLLRDKGWSPQKSNPKGIYVKQLDDDRALGCVIRSMAKRYPKRTKHSSDAVAHQAAEGGATPTRALQKDEVQ